MAGDEFFVLMEGERIQEKAASTAESILDALSEPL